MADNVTLNNMSGGAVIAADDIAGIMHQRVIVHPAATAGAASITGTAASPVQLPAVAGTLGVTVKARRANTGSVYVGGAGVNPADGFELAPGESISADLADPSALWLAVDVDGDGVDCLWVSA